MHVGLLTGSLTRGGSERVLNTIASYLVKRGHKVTFVTQFKEANEYETDPMVNRVISGLTPEEETGSRFRNLRKRIAKLSGIWEKERPDVILSFIGKNNFMAIRTGHRYGIPVAVSVRANKWMEYYNPLMTFLADHYLCRAEAVILQGPDIRKEFPDRVNKKALVMKNPIDPSFFEETYEGERDHTIVSVGRVDENKNHRLLIDAFLGIADRYPDWTLTIYGEGDLRQELKDYVKEQGMGDRIFLPGAVTDVPSKIKKAGVFVLPTNSEGAPNALIEAMILGLPCISTDCPIGIPRELIDHGVNGMLTPVSDLAKMQENLQNLLDNRQLREALGAKARATSVLYRPETVLSDWEKLLQGLADKKPVNSIFSEDH